MKSKLALTAITGLSVAAVSLTAATIIASTQSRNDWDDLFNFGDLPRCRADDTATARSRSIAWNGSDEVTIALPANVHYGKSGSDLLQLSGDPQIIAHVDVTDGTIDLNCDTDRPISIDVTLPDREIRRFTVYSSSHLFLDGISQPNLDVKLMGSGSVEGDGTLDRFSLSLGGHGTARLTSLAVKDLDLAITGSGEADVSASERAHLSVMGSGSARLSGQNLQRLETSIMGSGSVEGSGQAEQLKLDISGSGDAYLSRLMVRQADVSIHGSGDADIAPQDDARIDIAGSGEVTLFAEPKSINTHVTGSGTVRHAAPDKDAI